MSSRLIWTTKRVTGQIELLLNRETLFVLKKKFFFFDLAILTFLTYLKFLSGSCVFPSNSCFVKCSVPLSEFLIVRYDVLV